MERLFAPLLNHLLADQTWATTRLKRHAGAQALIEGGPFKLLLEVDASGHFVAGAARAMPDVTLNLPADFPFKLLLEREQLFSSVRLSGSVDFAETLAFVFRNLEWDVEADLAKLFGDIVAHRMVRLGRALGQALTQAVKRTGENIAEYVGEESGLLATNRDLQEFSSGVAALRDDLARLEKRVAKLNAC